MQKKKENISRLVREIVPLDRVSFHSSGACALKEILLNALPFSADEILVPNFCCERILLALLSAGKKYQLVNIHSNERVTPSLSEYQRALTPTTKAILLVYPWGYVPPDLLSIVVWAKENNLKIIEDIASSFGLSFQGRKLGTLGDYSFGSFGHDKLCSVGGLGFSNLDTEIISSHIPRNIQRLPYQARIKQLRQCPRLIRSVYFKWLSKGFPAFECPYPSDDKSIEEKIHTLQTRLSNYNLEIRDRKNNKEIYCNALSNLTDCTLIEPNNDEGVALRIPFLLPKGTNIRAFLTRMHKDDCWIGRDYPLFLHEWGHRSDTVDPVSIDGMELTGRMVNLITNPQNRGIQRTITGILEEYGARSRI